MRSGSGTRNSLQAGDQETRTKHSARLTSVQQPHAAGMGDRPVRDSFVPNGWHSEGGAQDFGFCAAISDLQLAENLFMSIPALTQSFIS